MPPLPSEGLPSNWVGYEHLADQIADELLGDVYSLNQLAVTCKSLQSSAQRALFRDIQLMNDHHVCKWQIKLGLFLSDSSHKDHPPNFQYIKDLAFSLSAGIYHNEQIIGLLDIIKFMLPNLKTIRVYGHAGLVTPSLGTEWFRDFIATTRPEAIHFNGTLVPNNVIDFDLSTLRTIHFNVCKLFFHDEEGIPGRRTKRDAALDAKMVLCGEGKGWERVNEFTSSSVNGEMLKIIERAHELKSLSFRLAFGGQMSLRSVTLSKKLRVLRLQIPNSVILHAPMFLFYLLQKEHSLHRIDLYFEIGWRRVLPWDHVCHYTLLYLLPRILPTSIRHINFRFGGLRHLPRFEDIHWDTFFEGINLTAMRDEGEPPCIPVPIPSWYYSSFTSEEVNLWNYLNYRDIHMAFIPDVDIHPTIDFQMTFLGDPPPGAGPVPLSWDELRFHPVGLYDLRSRLMGSVEPSVFQRFRPNFEAAEAAWFAAGLASSLSDIPSDEFFPELHELRRNTSTREGTEIRKALRKRIRTLTFDCAALMDRAFGSTTMVIHIPGTTRPRSLLREDYIKAETYFPPHLLREDERIPRAVFDIVQKCIRDIGIPTIARYQFCASRYWNLPDVNHVPPPYPRQAIQPPARPANSSIFEYNGQVIKAPIILLDDDDDNDREKESLKEELKEVQKLLEEANRSLAEARRREAELLAQVARLTSLSAGPRHVSPPAARPAPHTPDRLRAPGSRSPLSQPLASSGPTENRSPSRRGHPASSASSSSMDGASGGSATQSGISSSAGGARTDSQYADFIRANHLGNKYGQIERIRTNVAVYLPNAELSSLFFRLARLQSLSKNITTFDGSSLVDVPYPIFPSGKLVDPEKLFLYTESHEFGPLHCFHGIPVRTFVPTTGLLSLATIGVCIFVSILVTDSSLLIMAVQVVFDDIHANFGKGLLVREYPLRQFLEVQAQYPLSQSSIPKSSLNTGAAVQSEVIRNASADNADDDSQQAELKSSRRSHQIHVISFSESPRIKSPPPRLGVCLLSHELDEEYLLKSVIPVPLFKSIIDVVPSPQVGIAPPGAPAHYIEPACGAFQALLGLSDDAGLQSKTFWNLFVKAPLGEDSNARNVFKLDDIGQRFRSIDLLAIGCFSVKEIVVCCSVCLPTTWRKVRLKPLVFISPVVHLYLSSPTYTSKTNICLA
ncbi:hypothetical protein CVT26_002457 [Gymnopilus dilepis]|uniref:Uncharacterized protein n=1 Tax=Gymnopilus dilepis TaxID=231916 RepID=A0A409VT77_9AGAR|nr:hypothetical protein CVT26_002457 [Gymnopilus dilepis]